LEYAEKTIRNGVKQWIKGKNVNHPLLDLRPEKLGVEEFITLTQFVEKAMQN
jgi:hypothetical protein